MTKKRKPVDPDHVQWLEADGSEASPERVAAAQAKIQEAAIESYLKNWAFPAVQKAAGPAAKGVALSTEDPDDGMEGWLITSFHDGSEVRMPLPPGSIETMIDKALRGNVPPA